ncbi:MAG TPA: guanylate kinase [Halanaerobiales bacterium]|nr:guanylate kinase [Halanaerobiales bacterium]
MSKGILFVLSGPSGVGKGTVLEALMKNFKEVEYSVSATTRERRPGEIDGEDYFFISEERFKELKKNDKFIESAKVHNNYYGTPKKYVDRTLAEGKDIILEIDIQGAKQVKEKYPNAVFIFLKPPSIEELKNRLQKRNTENDKTKKVRLKNAKTEIQEISEYDYTILNDEVENAVSELKRVILKEQNKKGS